MNCFGQRQLLLPPAFSFELVIVVMFGLVFQTADQYFAVFFLCWRVKIEVWAQSRVGKGAVGALWCRPCWAPRARGPAAPGAFNKTAALASHLKYGRFVRRFC